MKTWLRHAFERVIFVSQSTWTGASCIKLWTEPPLSTSSKLQLCIRLCGIAILSLMANCLPCAPAEEVPKSLELSRPVRTWEFLSVAGQEAGIFGDETGRLEAWVYPLKILRNFQLRFLTESSIIPGASLARTITVRPESTSILYVGDTFTARETIFVPIREQGVVIMLEVSSSQPVEIEAVFERDFELMWPAAIGGSYFAWESDLHAFSFGDDLNRYSAFVGSPDANNAFQDYQSNYAQTKEFSFRLGTMRPGSDTRTIFIAGSTSGRDNALGTYRKLTSNYLELMRDAREYYQGYLGHTLQLELPDSDLQSAYDWSRISVLQGVVKNPTLGTGLVAGYRTSGDSLRPGFAWFFGRDALWTSLALNAEGDFSTSLAAMNFLLKYQREDGKIPHEVAQSEGIIPWFKDYPYAYASADATPLLLIAADDYVSRSGDIAFAKASWEKLWKAHEFLRSTRNPDGFAQNRGVGHGWVEGGPLHPVDEELYQAGLGIQAEHATAHLAQLLGKGELSKQLDDDYQRHKQKLNESFWSSEKSFFVFALGQENQQSDALTVLTTVPMWFGLFDEKKAEKTIDLLADSDFETDWGMRILSSRDRRYGGSGYHYGSVWPLFTGWASVGEYRYHHALPAFANLRANAMLALDGALGHVTEVLSGDQYAPLAASSPDQIWSAAMVVSPLLRGMLGLEIDANQKLLSFSPHLPADWRTLTIRNLSVGSQSSDLVSRHNADEIMLEATVRGGDGVYLAFSPAMSLRADVLGVELNGHAVPFHISSNNEDQHATVTVKLQLGVNRLLIRTKNDFGLSIHAAQPTLGALSQGLRVVSESWSTARDSLTIDFRGIAGETYELDVPYPGQIRSVDGGELVKTDDGKTLIRVKSAPSVPDGGDYTHGRAVIRFSAKAPVAIRKG